MVFLDREPRKQDRWLNLKVGSFAAGAVLGLAGIYFDAGWLVWTAVGVLLVGFAARFLPGSSERDPGADR